MIKIKIKNSETKKYGITNLRYVSSVNTGRINTRNPKKILQIPMYFLFIYFLALFPF